MYRLPIKRNNYFEVKSIINRLKISLDGLNSILKLADKNISKFESKWIEIMQSGEQRQRKGEKWPSLRGMSGTINWKNIYIRICLYIWRVE